MMDCTKYEKQYFMPPTPTFDWVKKEKIEKAPIWPSWPHGCSWSPPPSPVWS